MTRPDKHTPLDRAIDEQLRSLFEDPAPPPDLWQDITRAANSNHPVVHWWPPGLGLAVAMTLCVLALTLLIPMQHTSLDAHFPGTLIEELHTFRASGRALDVAETDPVKLQHWFTRKLAFQPPPPPASSTPTRLVGGRLCQIEDHRTVSYMYDFEGHLLSLFVTNRDDVSVAGIEQAPVRALGYGHIGWQIEDIQFHLVGGVPNQLLRELAREFKRNTQAPHPEQTS